MRGFPLILAMGGLDVKGNRYTQVQIIGVLKVHEFGRKVADLVRKLGFSEQSFYRWKSRFGGMEVSEAKRLREREAENGRLKKLLVDITPHQLRYYNALWRRLYLGGRSPTEATKFLDPTPSPSRRAPPTTVA